MSIESLCSSKIEAEMFALHFPELVSSPPDDRGWKERELECAMLDCLSFAHLHASDGWDPRFRESVLDEKGEPDPNLIVVAVRAAQDDLR